MDSIRTKNGKPKKRESPPDGWTSSMEYAFVFAKKSGQVRYLHRAVGQWVITDDEPEASPYWAVDPLGYWKEVACIGQLYLPTFRL